MVDAYFTPPELVHALIKFQPIKGTIWEPACGDGRITEVLERNLFPTVSSDVHYYGFRRARKFDFLAQEAPWKFDAIITNPPYSTGLIRPWIRKCAEYKPDVLALLCTIKAFADFTNPRMMGDMGLRRVILFRGKPRFFDCAPDGCSPPSPRGRLHGLSLSVSTPARHQSIQSNGDQAMSPWKAKIWRAKLAVDLCKQELAEMEDPSNPHAQILYRNALATLKHLRQQARREPEAAREPDSTGLPWVTLDEAARLVGLTPRSLAKRIVASGGKRAWALCGRLPGKAARFDRARFAEWWASPANRAPARTKADRRKCRLLDRQIVILRHRVLRPTPDQRQRTWHDRASTNRSAFPTGAKPRSPCRSAAGCTA